MTGALDAGAMSDLATNILAAVVIAAVTSWITVQLSLRRFRAEKWWEKKVAAYERVIEALHHKKAFTDAHLEAEIGQREVPDKRDKELREKSRQARLEIERATDVGSFALGDRAQERLRQYLKQANTARDASGWFEHLEADWKATDSCLKDMVQIAKEDLKLR